MTSSNPLNHFRKQAKDLLKTAKSGDSEALARVGRILKDSSSLTLMRAQHVVAVEAGFSKWNDLEKATFEELDAAIKMFKRIKVTEPKLHQKLRTPLGHLFRGPGVIPVPPYSLLMADFLDKMTPKQQERFLDDKLKDSGS